MQQLPADPAKAVARAQNAQTQSAPQKKSVAAPMGATPATAAAASKSQLASKRSAATPLPGGSAKITRSDTNLSDDDDSCEQ